MSVSVIPCVYVHSIHKHIHNIGIYAWNSYRYDSSSSIHGIVHQNGENNKRISTGKLASLSIHFSPNITCKYPQLHQLAKCNRFLFASWIKLQWNSVFLSSNDFRFSSLFTVNIRNRNDNGFVELWMHVHFALAKTHFDPISNSTWNPPSHKHTLRPFVRILNPTWKTI